MGSIEEPFDGVLINVDFVVEVLLIMHREENQKTRQFLVNS